MARPTIENIRQLSDYQTLYRWNLNFTTKPAAVAGFPDSNDLNLRCESSSIPKSSIQNTEVMIRGHKVMQPGILQYDNTLTLTFLETVDTKIRSALKAWREALWATKSGVAAGNRRSLAATVMLEQLDNQDNVVWRITLYGVYLQDYDLNQLDGQNNDAQKPQMTLSYDYFEDAPAANSR